MKRLTSMAATCVCAVAFAAGALADPADLTRASGPNTYFNRPGADMATHDRELDACLALARRAHQPDMAFSANFIANAFLSEEATAKSAVALAANTENCMVVRGWRVVAISQDEADAIAKLDRADQAQRLSEWVGSASPHGSIVRRWANDVADAATIKFRSGAWSGRANLSFTATDLAAEQRVMSEKLDADDSRLNLATPLAASEIASVPRGHAVVIFRVEGPSMHNGDNIVLRRETAGPGAAADAPDAFRGYDNPYWERGGKWFAFDAPPGRWRIAAIRSGNDIFELRLCLGSPSFDVGASEVVYAGAFDLGSAAIRPDLALDPVKAWLSKSGDAPQRVRPAVYTNGSTGVCGGTYIYSYEIPGAAFAPGYVGGGAPPAP